MELLEHLLLALNVSIDTKKSWYLFILNMHQVLVGQVPQENVASVRAVLSQSVQNAMRLLQSRLIIGLSVSIGVFLPICIFLVLDELIIAILINFGAIFHITIYSI